MKKIRRKRDRALADRSREAEEELERGTPRVARFSDDEDLESVFAAGVAAAGESDRPVGTSVAPEYPSGEPRSEIDVDRVFGTVLEDPDAPEPTAAPSERPRE
jgi:hypothetical protein